MIDSQNHFLVKVKANQPTLLKAVKDTVRTFVAVDELLVKETNRGRKETRLIKVFNQKYLLPYQWNMVNSIIVVVREFVRKDKIHQTISLYISDLETTNAKLLLQGIRGHWYIENKLHYTKDVIQKEDKTATKNKIAAANLSIFRNFCFNILKAKNKSIKYASEYFANNNVKELLCNLIRT
ncbi:ISAs1 family transposase [Dysgonomonas sp. 511]|nr:ISAs1 family transposase [Dysgonomonas sp. 511]